MWFSAEPLAIHILYFLLFTGKPPLIQRRFSGSYFYSGGQSLEQLQMVRSSTSTPFRTGAAGASSGCPTAINALTISPSGS
jgi:hypothetical protein